jgi:5S rRNA maturation endonuclease (ribonuclease M5)
MTAMSMWPVKMNSYKDRDWNNFKDDLENMKEAVDSRYLLESLGFKIERETTKELRGPCLIHGGDNKTAFRFNKERKSWVCFTHKCHEVYGNDIIGLIKAVLGIDFLEAVNYLRNFVGDIKVRSVELRAKRERERFIEYSKKPNSEIEDKRVNEKAIKYYKPFRSPSFLNEGFSVETLDFFEVGGGWVDKEGVTRDVIPIRDDSGVLVAYALRDIRKEADDDRKYIFTSGFSKDKVLYNMNNAKRYGMKLPLIIVEGQKSVWKFHQLGIQHSVAIMGSRITNGQKLLLYKYAYKGVVLMFDNDIAGVNGMLTAAEELKGVLNVNFVFITEVDENGDGLGPSDLPNDVILEYLKFYI